MVDLSLNVNHVSNQAANQPANVIEANALTLHNVSVQFGQKTILNKLNIELKRGKIALLYGANGAGKSTLLRLLAGLHGQAKISGSGSVLNKPLWPRSGAMRTQLGYMPQHGGLYEELSVLENLSFRAGMLGAVNANALALQAARHHELEPVLAQRVGQLSGGWKQRVAFAVALLANPELILLDEPTAGVDLEAKSQLWSRVKALAARGVTVLISSHDTDEAARADVLICLQDGQISFMGAPKLLCLSLNLRIANLRVKDNSKAIEMLQVLNKLQHHPSFLFIDSGKKDDTDKNHWRIAWLGDADLASALNIPNADIQWQPPQLEDGLRAILRANKPLKI